MLLVISHRKWKISVSTKQPSSKWFIVVITMLLYGNCSLVSTFTLSLFIRSIDVPLFVFELRCQLQHCKCNVNALFDI